jgi:hypothetical protein
MSKIEKRKILLKKIFEMGFVILHNFYVLRIIILRKQFKET